MAKKRKSDATRLDEVDRSMYSSFCSAANSLSQLHTQAMNHQRLLFQAGERNALEKLYQWILRKQEEGTRVATVDIFAYLQNELDYSIEEPPPASPRVPFQQNQLSSDQQTKNSVFSNALSSPVRRNLQHYHSSPPGRAHQLNNLMSSANVPSPNLDSPSDSMDMHTESPGRGGAPY
ncbi:uncharacterized protein [Rutidosis leptorrhynchoides]|uniref:uncharacterized protein n=1 Tax=Rutidosis leptorrhynchoides TaxID=125765 RepID=UPI003A9977B6